MVGAHAEEPTMDPLLDDPADLTPHQRFQAVAAILARGVLRLKECPDQPPQPGPGADHGPALNSQFSYQKALELPRSPRPDPQPVNGRRRGRRAQA